MVSVSKIKFDICKQLLTLVEALFMRPKVTNRKEILEWTKLWDMWRQRKNKVVMITIFKVMWHVFLSETPSVSNIWNAAPVSPTHTLTSSLQKHLKDRKSLSSAIIKVYGWNSAPNSNPCVIERYDFQYNLVISKVHMRKKNKKNRRLLAADARIFLCRMKCGHIYIYDIYIYYKYFRPKRRVNGTKLNDTDFCYLLFTDIYIWLSRTNLYGHYFCNTFTKPVKNEVCGIHKC